MLRFIAPSLSLLLALPLGAHAVSKQEYALNQKLQEVAKESSVGTPRAINEDILRFMTVKVEALEDGPSAQMRRREDRERRDDRLFWRGFPGHCPAYFSANSPKR